MTLSRQTLDFIRDHAHEDIHALALQTPKYPDVDMPAAILQIAGKQAAANKIPSWAAIEGILYPRHLSMEQCSSVFVSSCRVDENTIFPIHLL